MVSYILPSWKKMQIIIFMLKNEIITFKTQNIYRNNISFKNAMKNLYDRGLILSRRKNGMLNEYTLSDKGEYTARALDELAR